MESKKNVILSNCQSLEDVLELIIGGGTSYCSASEIAEIYAREAAKDNGDESSDEIVAHLSILKDALEDGEALAQLGYNDQELVETAWQAIKDAEKNVLIGK